MQRNLKFIAIVWSIWTLLSILFTLKAGFVHVLKDRPVYWWHIFVFTYTSAMVWVPGTWLIYRLVLKFPINLANWPRITFWHLLIAIPFAGIHRFLSISLDYFLQTRLHLLEGQFMAYPDYFQSLFIGRSLEGMLTYFLVLTILYGYRYYLDFEKTTRLQAETQSGLLEAQLANLKFQLQPHFLFNSLQAVSTLMHRNVDEADQAVSKLGDLLRMSLQHQEKQLVRVEEELDFVRKYAHLQMLRFKDKFKLEIHCEDQLLDGKIPFLLLQPLVENSLKHGMERKEGSLTIEIDIKRTEKFLDIVVKDNGIGDNLSSEVTHGLGLSNVKKRLDMLYSEAFCSFAPDPEGGFLNRIRIPWEQ